MGLTPGTEVTMVKYAPMGDPLEIRLRGYELTIRAADAAQISLENVHDAHEKVRLQVASGVTSHPAIGENKLRPRAAGGVVPAGKPLSFALAGNQNCGKTTLFNQLTGSNQHVGNFPGVTVDRKDGQMRSHPEATVTDLPGIYSLSPYTGEEVVSRQFIIDSKPDAIINIVDATNIERNLYLTTQLMELDVPMVIALNMMDEVTENGGSVDVNALESFLGVPVVPISAAKDEGVDELVEHAIHVARYRERPGRIDFCRPDGPDGGAVHRCIHAIGELVSDHAERACLPDRYAATKLIEGDELVIKALGLEKNELRRHGAHHLPDGGGSPAPIALRLSPTCASRSSGHLRPLRQEAAGEPRARALLAHRPCAYGALHRHPVLHWHHDRGVLAHLRPHWRQPLDLMATGVSAASDAIDSRSPPPT